MADSGLRQVDGLDQCANHAYPRCGGNILTTIAERQGKNALAVDTWLVTTDVFSVFDGVFNRTVSANLGMSYSISNVVAEAGLTTCCVGFIWKAWTSVSFATGQEQDDSTHHDSAKSKPSCLKSRSPRSVASGLRATQVCDHAEESVQQQRTVGDTFSQKTSRTTIVDAMKLTCWWLPVVCSPRSPPDGTDAGGCV